MPPIPSQKPRFILRSAGNGGNVRHVLLGGRVVGSLVFNAHSERPFWTWSVTAISTAPGATSGAEFGTAETLADAMAAWRRSWEAIETGPHSWMPEPPEWRPGSWRGTGG